MKEELGAIGRVHKDDFARVVLKHGVAGLGIGKFTLPELEMLI